MPCNPAEIKNGKLLIGINASDTPGSPLARALPDGTVYWGNPNIKLVGGVNEGKARVDPNPALTPDHFIDVTVANITAQTVGDDFARVKVEVWVCDFSMGVTPSSSRPSSNPGGLPLEGTASGPIPATGTRSTTIRVGPWKPTAADAALNGGHLCIAANCYVDDGSDGSPLSLRPGALANTFSFLCDTHHGQRNIALVTQSAAMGGMGFRMMLANPLTVGDFDGAIEIRRINSKAAMVMATRNFLRSAAEIAYFKGGVRDLEPLGASLVMPDEVTLGGAIGQGRYMLRLSEREYAPLFYSRFRPQFDFEAEGLGAGRDVRVRLREGQTTPLTVQLKFNRRERPGATHAFDLVQRDTNGTVVGGARIVVVITP